MNCQGIEAPPVFCSDNLHVDRSLSAGPDAISCTHRTRSLSSQRHVIVSHYVLGFF